jgi:glycosyltransferase involved in cell wall biosynthesis
VTIDDILRRRGVEGYRFVIVGDGSERPWLAAHLRHAEFRGVLSGLDLAEAYAGFDAFVFPSETDTYGNVVLEAMASGVPVVVTAAGGPRFLVRECVTGLVCRDAGDMANAVTRLMRDRPMREAMRQAARRRAVQASWDRVFDRLYDAYRTAPFAPRVAAGTFGRRDLTVVARAVRSVFRFSGHRPTPQGPLAPSAGTPVIP